MTADPRIAQMEEVTALPRKNGELVFAEPWEARAFGIAVVLNDTGRYPWRDFSQGLAAETAMADRHHLPAGYYERWLETLEKLVIAKGFISHEELQARMTAYLSGDYDDHEEHHHEGDASTQHHQHE